MKALVFHGARDIRYESFDDPKITDDHSLIIKVEHCSICGSDLHMYHGGRIGPMDYSQPMEHFCTGHEAIGEVVETGSAVRSHKVGDRILVAGGSGCGECKRCRAGSFNQCEGVGGVRAMAYGITPGLQGVHADYLQVANADLGATKIPDGVTDEQAILLTDALATGYYGVKMAGVKPGDSVAVIGQGPVGLMAAESAMAVGASRVYCIDPQEARRNQALSFGGIPLHPDQALDQIKHDTQGVGVDAVIEAVGVGPTLKQALKLVRLGGRMSILGIIQADTVMPFNIVQGKSVTVHAGTAGVADLWDEIIPLIQGGRIRGDGVFTHYFSLSEGAEAFRLFDAREDNIVKAMLTP